jgi:hypothetical protein
MSPRDVNDDFPELSPPRRSQSRDPRPGASGAPTQRASAEPSATERWSRSPLRFGRYIALFS